MGKFHNKYSTIVAKFRKKSSSKKSSIEIEATQWFENGDHEFVEPSGLTICRDPLCGLKMSSHGWLHSKEGGNWVCPRDWIITSANGERYPCKPDFFERTYEPVVNPGGQPHG